MDINIDEIRADVRGWLEENWDPERPLIEWRNMLVDARWAAPDWPTAFHGRDLPPSAVIAINEEFEAVGAIGAAKSGVRNLAAATLLEHGNDAQKSQFLRGILTGEEAWCQLFSEPGSGSDLAGATTRADRKGNQWIINGQKVWNTSAHHAEWGLLVARTDWDQPKHKGLTYFIIDMRQPGVEVRQLRQMNGHASFNEVFFTDAVVLPEHMISEENNGWPVAVTTLAHERAGFNRFGGRDEAGASEGRIYDEFREEVAVANEPYIWYPQRAGRVDLIVKRAKETGAINDPVTRQQIARVLSLHQASQWYAERLKEDQKAGRARGPEGSITKVAATKVARQASDTHTAITGIDAMLTGPESPEDGIIAEILVSVPAVSIAGGTDEIQLNIISERLLDMPKEPRFDTGPFKDVKRN